MALIFTALENSTIRVSYNTTSSLAPLKFYLKLNGEDLPVYTWDGGSGGALPFPPDPIYDYPLIELSKGDILELSSSASSGYFSSSTEYYTFKMTGSIGCSGDLKALIGGSTQNEFRPYSLYRVFKDCATLRAAPEIPACWLDEHAMEEAFMGCTGLTYLPGIPKLVRLRDYSCKNMYKGCTGATGAGDIEPIDTWISQSTYTFQGMYEGCTGLTYAPAVHSRTSYEGLCYQMFKGCTSLQHASVWFESLATTCCYQMFQGCTALNHVNAGFMAWNGNATYQWLDNTAPTGTFIGVASLDTTKSSSTVPTGWIFQGHGDYLTFYTDAPDRLIDLAITKVGYPADALFEYRYKTPGGAYETTWSPWQTLALGTAIPYSVTANRVQVRRAPQGKVCELGTSSENCYTFTISGRTQRASAGTSDNVYCSGELDSMINWDPITPFCFNRLFLGTDIRTVPDMPSTTMAESCYERLYYGCIRLTSGGTIPAVTMSPHCFRNMYSGCVSLRRLTVEFTSWVANGYDTPDFTPTKDWLDRVYADGRFCKPSALPVKYGVDGNPWISESDSVNSSSESLDCSDSTGEPYFGIDPESPPAQASLITSNIMLVAGYIDSDLIGPEVKDLNTLDSAVFAAALNTAKARGTIINIPAPAHQQLYTYYNPNYCPSYRVNWWHPQYFKVSQKAGCWIFIAPNAQIAQYPSEVTPAILDVSNNPLGWSSVDGSYYGVLAAQEGYKVYGPGWYVNSQCRAVLGGAGWLSQWSYATAYRAFSSGDAGFAYKPVLTGSSMDTQYCTDLKLCRGTSNCPEAMNAGDPAASKYCSGYWVQLVQVYVAGFWMNAYGIIYSTDRLDPSYMDPTGANKTVCSPHCVDDDEPCEIAPDCTVYSIVGSGYKTRDEATCAGCLAVRAAFCANDPESEECQNECYYCN